MVGPKTGARMIGTPIMLMSRGSARGPAAFTRMIWPTGSTRPPPIPCRTRKTMSDSMFHAKPHSSEPSVKSTSEVM